MSRSNRRYKTMERYMTTALLLDLILFILYLFTTEIIALKVILSIVIIAISGLCLAFLYMSGELRKARSLWMVTGAGAILICLIFSLLCNFP